MKPLTKEQDYALWCAFVPQTEHNGWRFVGNPHKWVFQAPSGSLHDLSGADLNKLDYIEQTGLFLVKA